MSDLKHPDIDQAEDLLRPLMPLPHRFGIVYRPKNPTGKGGPYPYFQLCLAVPMNSESALRAQIHDLVPKVLDKLSQVKLAREAACIGLISMLAIPDAELASFQRNEVICAEWAGSDVRKMQECRDFSIWPSMCISYHNHCEINDVLNWSKKKQTEDW